MKKLSIKQLTFSAFVVLVLIFIDAAMSVSYAKGKNSNKITIFKVTKVSPNGDLKLRAWPSTKSRIKKALPYNAKDLTETGKKRVIGSTKWLEVNWKNTQGWVNSRYLKKTGVLLHKKPNVASAPKSRNVNSTKRTKIKAIIPVETPNEMPEYIDGDRYDQPTKVTEMKTAYSNRRNQSSQQLLCSGRAKKPWNIKLDMAAKRMSVNLSRNHRFSVPINYHEWASPTQMRINIGGKKGRNIVDVNLEKTNACSNGLSRTNFSYRINATINRQFYSGCCAVSP